MGYSLPNTDLQGRLQGSMAHGDLSPTSSPPIWVCSIVLSYILPPLSGCCSTAGFLHLFIPEPLLLSLMGSASASDRSTLDLAGVGSIGHGVKFWQHLTSSHFTTCHANQIDRATVVGFWKMRYSESREQEIIIITRLFLKVLFRFNWKIKDSTRLFESNCCCALLHQQAEKDLHIYWDLYQNKLQQQ